MSNYKYPNAGKKAPKEVKKAIKNFHNESKYLKNKKPLLYYLLGDGTSPYKMSKFDSNYQNEPKEKQKCENCKFLYYQPLRENYICSQIRGKVEPEGWCRLWKQ